MKKILFILVALMFAAPAWAVVDISMAQVEDTNEVIISITSDEANLVRAYSLDIQLAPYLDSNAPVVLEVTSLNPGYWVFPGTIQINAEGQITNPGSPVAEYGDLPSDTLGGLDSNGVTVELASLYVGEVNEPVQNGPLLSVKVSDDACITVTANVPRAGASGVVMEDPEEEPVVNLPAELCIEVVTAPPECYEGQPDYDQWELFEKPLCWCDKRQCHGNATGEPPEGGAKTGYWYVGLGDLNVLISAWKVLEPAVAPTPSGPGILTVTDGICADFSHSAEGGAKTGYWRVGLGDLNILIAHWKVLEPAVAPTPSGPGVPPDCLDLP